MAIKMVELKRKYIIESEIGNASGTLRRLLFWYWERKTRYMRVDEILSLYRLLSEK